MHHFGCCFRYRKRARFGFVIITPVAAGEILGVSERRVRQLVQSGELKSEGRFGATVTVDKASVLRLKEKRDRQQKEDTNGSKG